MIKRYVFSLVVMVLFSALAFAKTPVRGPLPATLAGTVSGGGGGGGTGSFGNVGYSAAASDYQPIGTNQMFCGKFASSQGAAISVTKMTTLMQGSGSHNVKALVYDDDGAGNIPDTLMGVSDPVAVTTSKASYENDFSSTADLPGDGDWWLCVISDSNSVNVFAEIESGAYWFGTGNYATPASSPTESTSDTGAAVCTYADYTY